MEILIVKLAALGDVLRTTSLLKPLRRRYPHCRIWWLTAPAALPLLERNSWIYKILVWPQDFHALPQFDLVLSLEENEETAALAERACVGEFVGVRSKIGRFKSKVNSNLCYTPSSAPYYSMSLLNPDPNGGHKTADALKAANRKTYAEIWLEVLNLPRPKRVEDLGPIFILKNKDRAVARRLAKRYGFRRNRPIGFNPGAGRRWPAKQISERRSAEIVDALHRKFKRPVILFGGKDETQRNRAIIKQSKSPVIDAGTRHGLREFAGLLDLCGLVVATDSLAFHVATALAKPAVVLVGPTSASELDVFGKGKVLTPAQGCDCFYRPRCRYETSCLDSISLAAILNAARTWLQ